jgi:glucokinase
MILAGDIGGTKCNLGLFELSAGKLSLVAQRRFPSQEHASLREILDSFLRQTGAVPSAACFAVAGPVVENRAHVTNLLWVVDGPQVARSLQLPFVRILNDLEATAHGLPILQPSDFEILSEGTPGVRANQGLIAAGTGLGEALLIWDGQRHVVSASEAGHADFAPHTEQEAELLRYLMKRYSPVSWEVILSGRGFRELHNFLDPQYRHASFDLPHADAAPEITRRALDGTCPVCVDTVRMWAGIYGSEAGNLAIRLVARGGIFVAGGIALKILPFLKDGRFVSAFHAKEKMQELLSLIPIAVVKNEAAPLWGAALAASIT